MKYKGYACKIDVNTFKKGRRYLAVSRASRNYITVGVRDEGGSVEILHSSSPESTAETDVMVGAHQRQRYMLETVYNQSNAMSGLI